MRLEMNPVTLPKTVLRDSTNYNNRDDRKLGIDLPCCGDGFAEIIVEKEILGFSVFIENQNQFEMTITPRDLHHYQIDADLWTD